MEKNKYTICVIRGDGIGPEVVDAALKLLENIPLSFKFIQAEMGYDYYQKSGTPLPEDTIKKCKKADAILFGAITTPPKIKNYFSPIVRLRKELRLFANVRPFFSLPIDGVRQDIDFIIVRENTEDLYIGREKIIKNGAVAQRLITKKACRDVVEFAFNLAASQKRKKVTAVHKANILRLTDGLFLTIAEEIARKYPTINFENMLVDACAMNLIKKPDYFDVLVTTNMFGDILSDEAAALVGGLGVAASANIGKKYALFEPVHGSAPKYAGQNQANPAAALFAVALLLDHLGENKHAKAVRDAIIKAIKDGCVTPDLGGKLRASEVTQEIIKNYKKYDYH